MNSAAQGTVNDNASGSLHRLFLPCAAGVEEWLAAEVARIVPARRVDRTRGGVSLDGDLADVCALNLECRIAQRVLLEVAHGAYRDEHDIHALARTVAWPRWITPRQTLRVDTTAHRSPLHSLNFTALRVKDAVCDMLREATGERPSVNIRHPDLAVALHAGERDATLYIDTSGESLFKRGWREDTGDAPLKETLAASLLAVAGWNGSRDGGGALHDPVCGSGTIAIEAAQIACGIAPGIGRPFAFERLQPFQSPAIRQAWQQVRAAAKARVHDAAVPIVASDVSFRMVDFARRNADRAGVARWIEFHGGDALERPAPKLAPDLPGTLVLNPPYGARIDVAGKSAPTLTPFAAPRGGAAGLGSGPAPSRRREASRDSAEDRDTPDDFYARLAAHWKRAYTEHPAGWTAWILSPDPKLPQAMRLKASRRVPMWNGPIECRLFRFELVAGRHDAPRAGPAPATPAPEPPAPPGRSSPC